MEIVVVWSVLRFPQLLCIFLGMSSRGENNKHSTITGGKREKQTNNYWDFLLRFVACKEWGWIHKLITAVARKHKKRDIGVHTCNLKVEWFRYDVTSDDVISPRRFPEKLWTFGCHGDERKTRKKWKVFLQRHSWMHTPRDDVTGHQMTPEGVHDDVICHGWLIYFEVIIFTNSAMGKL